MILDQTAQCPGPGCFDHLAIANPETAPYGQAAMAVITAMGLTDRLAGKIVKMGNITACYASVQGGAAPIGFVAVSQVIDNDTGNMRPGQSVWVVPKTLHPPIEQGAVLLQNGAANPVARDFLAYLRQDRAQAIMRRYGYDIPGP